MSDGPERTETCVVCFKTVEYYSIGECDHPVCYECSTRMRVLCLQNECPICRQELSRVVFTESVLPYKTLRAQVFSDKLFERQYKIGFCCDEIKEAYERVLEHRCKMCPKLPPFRTFNLLSDHTRKVHERYFCDLCVKHLKIFTSERKCYTRQELAHHRRKGDLDDTSHRGHPLCEFCEERYMDTDELYRHLRKDHLYCHLCDADGRNLYYASHAALAQHFRSDHYLCEEGDCAGQHLTAVFRTDIDLKAHKASVHGRGLARAAARQARTLELQFNITPHQFAGRQNRSETGGGGGGGGGAGGAGGREGERGGGAGAGDREPIGGGGGATVFAAAATARIDTGSVEQFPRLSTAGPAPVSLAAPSRLYQGSSGLAKTKENFPTLDGGPPRSAPPPAAAPRGPPAAALLRTNGKPSVSIPLHGQPSSASNFRLTGARASPAAAAPAAAAAARRAALYEDFPSLSVPDDDRPSIGAASLQPPKVGLVSSEQMEAMKSSGAAGGAGTRRVAPPPALADAFPALSASRAAAAPPKWINVAKPKEKPKASKVTPAPKLTTPAFNPVADFPQLTITNNKSKNKKSTAERTQPEVSRTTAEEVSKPGSKKEKKKQNNVRTIALEELSDGFNGKTSKKNKSPTAWDAKKIGKENKAENTQPADDGAGERPNGLEKLSNGDGSYTALPEHYPPLAGGGGSGSGRLTFTNSSGETFSAPLHSYIPPPDFHQRNALLVQQFADALGVAAMDDFKNASRAFRTGGISADEFYGRCKRALGSRLQDLFPELVALLPDIGKQQALVVGREMGLDMCAACGQLLAPRDTPAHRTAHWPALAQR